MKLKKFFAGVLAAAMMLTVGATAAFAVSGGGTSSETKPSTIAPDKDLGIKVNYVVANGTAPSDKFTFDVTYKSEKSHPYTDTYTYTGTKSAEFKENMPAKANATDEKDKAYQASLGIEISDFNLPAGPGKYCFEIKQSVPTNQTPGVTYDLKTRYLVITVVNKEIANGYDGYEYYAQLYDNSYNRADSIKDTTTSINAKVDGDDAFKNIYSAFNIVISKDIEGNFGDLAKKFTFKVKLTATNGKTATQYVGAKVTEYTGETADVRNQVWAIDGTTEHTISLGRNQSITLTNLPKDDVIVTVEETDSGEYTVTNSGTGNTRLDGSTITAIISSGENRIGFINTRRGTPDMGVVLDNAPYIALLAIVAIGGVALMLNKRRRDEE